MASLIANLALGVLSMGAVATAVTIPLTSGGVAVTTPKSHKDWKTLDDFQRYCFGGFLKEEGIGELIVCQDETEKDSANNPIFYLIWGNDGTEAPKLVEKIRVGDYRRDKWQVEVFTDKSNYGQKALIIDKDGPANLKALDSFSQKNNCKIIEPKSISSDNNYFLECSLSNNKYKVSIKRSEFAF